MNVPQNVEDGSPGADAVPRSRTVQAPPQLAEAMALLRHEIRERRQVEERLRQANDEMLRRLAELEQRDRDHLTLGQLSNYLKSCVSTDEACTVITAFGPQLIPSEVGTLYRLNSPGGYLERVAGWGQITQEEKPFTVQDCWGLRRGRLHWTNGAGGGLLCQHAAGSAEPTFPHMCIPLVAHGETVGLLFLQRLRTPARAQGGIPESKLPLASALGEEISLALANLKLCDALRQQSLRDPLTGLYNRRGIEERFDALMREGFHTVALLDIDHFKVINDTMGHGTGDTVLQAVAVALMPDEDTLAARIGGEEFLVLLRGKDAGERAERRRKSIPARIAADVPDLDRLVTASMGMVTCEAPMPFAELYGQCDRLLYAAKGAGRNCTERESLAAPAVPQTGATIINLR